MQNKQHAFHAFIYGTPKGNSRKCGANTKRKIKGKKK